MKSQHTAHADLKNLILSDLGCRHDVLVWNTPTGVFRFLDSESKIAIGKPGMPDIHGVRRYNTDRVWIAAAFAVEVKTGKGRLRLQQDRWRLRFEALGGLYVVARSVEDIHHHFGPPEPAKGPPDVSDCPLGAGGDTAEGDINVYAPCRAKDKLLGRCHRCGRTVETRHHNR